jgi:hypothetical protein
MADAHRTASHSGVSGVNLLWVAFIDVVMETDHAGLELYEYIRDHLRLRGFTRALAALWKRAT